MVEFNKTGPGTNSSLEICSLSKVNIRTLSPLALITLPLFSGYQKAIQCDFFMEEMNTHTFFNALFNQ
jgi:hypothetical protein